MTLGEKRENVAAKLCFFEIIEQGSSRRFFLADPRAQRQDFEQTPVLRYWPISKRQVGNYVCTWSIQYCSTSTSPAFPRANCTAPVQHIRDHISRAASSTQPSHHTPKKTSQLPPNMPRLTAFLLLATLIWPITAQFGFFDQMFGGGGSHNGGGQHQRGEPQNVRSDSSWYQAQYEGGT